MLARCSATMAGDGASFDRVLRKEPTCLVLLWDQYREIEGAKELTYRGSRWW